MSKPQDGFVSRFLNRPVSRRLTSVLLKFPIHPSGWTISIFVLPLIAGAFLVRGGYADFVIGAAIFQAFSILDGCDGEIARAKNLESKFGERLDNFCDFLASVIYVLALGWGLHHSVEGIVCASFITANEWLLRGGKGKKSFASSILHESFYARHHGMIGHSGLLNLGERFVWWLFQLTKRDMAIFVFLILALLGLADWILHLWTIVAGATLVLSAIAASRSGIGRGHVVTREPGSSAGSQPGSRIHTLSQVSALLRKPSGLGHLSLCTSQHLRSVDILPPALAYIYGTDFIIVGHQPNSIGQAAIAAAATGLRLSEIAEDFEWANKQADINRIVIA